MLEWAKGGWTFHGKGLWLTFPGDRRPAASVVGSSNFGYRFPLPTLVLPLPHFQRSPFHCSHLSVKDGN